jgi:hypothetical protein
MPINIPGLDKVDLSGGLGGWLAMDQAIAAQREQELSAVFQELQNQQKGVDVVRSQQTLPYDINIKRGESSTADLTQSRNAQLNTPDNVERHVAGTLGQQDSLAAKGIQDTETLESSIALTNAGNKLKTMDAQVQQTIQGLNMAIGQAEMAGPAGMARMTEFLKNSGLQVDPAVAQYVASAGSPAEMRKRLAEFGNQYTSSTAEMRAFAQKEAIEHRNRMEIERMKEGRADRRTALSEAGNDTRMLIAAAKGASDEAKVAQREMTKAVELAQLEGGILDRTNIKRQIKASNPKMKDGAVESAIDAEVSKRKLIITKPYVTALSKAKTESDFLRRMLLITDPVKRAGEIAKYYAEGDAKDKVAPKPAPAESKPKVIEYNADGTRK